MHKDKDATTWSMLPNICAIIIKTGEHPDSANLCQGQSLRGGGGEIVSWFDLETSTMALLD